MVADFVASVVAAVVGRSPDCLVGSRTWHVVGAGGLLAG